MKIVNQAHSITALQRACCDGNDEQVKTFIDEDLTDENILRKDLCGETALHDAIKNGNTECCMLLLNRLQSPMPAQLSQELINICTEDMSTVADKLSREVFQQFDFDNGDVSSQETTSDYARAQEVQNDETFDNQSEPIEVQPKSISSFDELKDQLSKNLENLRFLWVENKETLFLLNQFLLNSSQIGADFLPLRMFLEAVKLRVSRDQKGKVPQASRITKLFLAYCYRLFGKQFLNTIREVGFLVPTDTTLRDVGSKEFDIPPRIQPGFIGGMMEEAIAKYGNGKKLILSNDERKCKAGIVNGVGAAVYPGHKSYEKVKQKEFAHLERMGKLNSVLVPTYLYPSDFTEYCLEEFDYNNESEALEQRSTGYMRNLKRKADDGDSKSAYLYSRQLAKRQEYAEHRRYKSGAMISYAVNLKDIRSRPYYLLNPHNINGDNDMRYLSETSVQFTSTINNALLKKSQVPAALGFRTVAEAASVQHINTPVQDQDEDESVGDINDSHLFDDSEIFSEQRKQAVTTLTHLVMPEYYQDLVLIQEGLGVIRKDALSGPGFVAHADASMVGSVENPVIKASIHITKTDAYKETPRAEDLAMLYCQMAAFLQYAEDPFKPPKGIVVEIDRFDCFMRVWEVEIKPNILKEVLQVIRQYFCSGVEGIKEIKKSLPKSIRDLRSKLEELVKEARHMGDFPLLTFSRGDVLPCRNSNYNFCPTTIVDRLGLSGTFLIEALRQSREDAYSYTLIKACTIMIYTLADVMREASDVTYFPIFWYPAATDLGCEIDKAVTEYVLNELKRRGLDVVASSFDGKSHPRVTTGMKGEPQTLIQLAKQHWKTVKELKTVEEVRNKFYLEREKQRKQTSKVPRLTLLALEKVTQLRINCQERLKGVNSSLPQRYRSLIDKHYPVQRVAVWRQELAYMTFGEKYDSFLNKNEYHEEMNKLFGVVFYNPPQVCDKPLWSLLDYTHNLNRLRTFTYSGRIPGVNPTAWQVAADTKDPVTHRPATNLTRSMLDAGGKDQMSIRQTRTFFSPKVQCVMRENGFYNEADWAQQCYDYLISVDDRHITAENRLKSWLTLWNTLMGFVNTTKFPPLGSTLPLFKDDQDQGMIDSGIPQKKGMPVELFEATLAAIQARVQLYGACPNGYAARAISSIDTENFHGILHRQHHHGAQTASVYEVEGSLAHLTVALKIKKEPAFVGLLSPIQEDDSIYPIPMTGFNISQRINLVNCNFDLIKGSNKNKEAIPRRLHEPPRGALPVRAAGNHKANEEC